MPARRRRKQTMDPGRFQLERERFHLDPDYVPPPPDNTKTLGEVLPGVMKDMGLVSQWNVADLVPKWPNLVGAANAAHCKPSHWEKGILTVSVDHHVWLAELQRFGKGAILKRLQKEYGAKAVKDVYFEMEA